MPKKYSKVPSRVKTKETKVYKPFPIRKLVDGYLRVYRARALVDTLVVVWAIVVRKGGKKLGKLVDRYVDVSAKNIERAVLIMDVCEGHEVLSRTGRTPASKDRSLRWTWLNFQRMESLVEKIEKDYAFVMQRCKTILGSKS